MPAGVTTLLAIRTAVRQRADMVGSTFITDAEFNAWINSSYQELYDVLVQKYGDTYFATTQAITTDGTNDSFALAVDFFKLLGVDLRITTAPTGYVTLRKFEFIDRNLLSAPMVAPVYGVSNLRYRVSGNNLLLRPLPSSGQVLRVWYVPRLAALANDADTVDGVSGWEEYIIADCVIKALSKEESDCSVPMAQKTALLARITDAAADRDVGQAPTVSDVTSVDDRWPGWGR